MNWFIIFSNLVNYFKIIIFICLFLPNVYLEPLLTLKEPIIKKKLVAKTRSNKRSIFRKNDVTSSLEWMDQKWSVHLTCFSLNYFRTLPISTLFHLKKHFRVLGQNII